MPNSPASLLLENVLALHHAITRVDEHVAAAMGLNPGDVSCVRLLHEEGPLRPTDISRRLDMHPATLTGRLARMEQAGWITRCPSPTDGRTSVIEFNPACQNRIEDSFAAVRKDLEEVTQRYVDLLPQFNQLTADLLAVLQQHSTPT